MNKLYRHTSDVIRLVSQNCLFYPLLTYQLSEYMDFMTNVSANIVSNYGNVLSMYSIVFLLVRRNFFFFLVYYTYKYSCLFCLVKLYSAFCMAIYYIVGQKMEMIISPCVGERGKNEKSRNFGTTNIIRRLILIIINKAVFRTA